MGLEGTLDADGAQKLLDGMHYDYQAGASHRIYSPVETYNCKAANCINGALLAAYSMGIEPNLLFMMINGNSHVVLIVEDVNGILGAVGKSRDKRYQGRPIGFYSIEELARSYEPCNFYVTCNWENHHPNWKRTKNSMEPPFRYLTDNRVFLDNSQIDLAIFPEPLSSRLVCPHQI